MSSLLFVLLPVVHSSQYNNCPLHSVELPNNTGCAYTPRDVLFDTKTQQALQTLLRSSSTGGKQQQQQEALDELSGAGDWNHVTLTIMGYKGGAMKDQINQDRAMIVSPLFGSERAKLCGVWDGHGYLGERVSEFAAQQTPLRLVNAVRDTADASLNNENLIIQALKNIFIEIDRDVPTNGMGGSTASMALQVGSQLYIANVGDSRTIVATHCTSLEQTRVAYITREDKPHLKDEHERIVQMGGHVWIPPDLELESSRVIHMDPQTGQQVLAIGIWLDVSRNPLSK